LSFAKRMVPEMAIVKPSDTTTVNLRFCMPVPLRRG
jgi:hypothetical protein